MMPNNCGRHSKNYADKRNLANNNYMAAVICGEQLYLRRKTTE